MLKAGNTVQERLRRLCMFCPDGAKLLAVSVDTAHELLRRRCVFSREGTKFLDMLLSLLLRNFHVGKLNINTVTRTAAGCNVARAATGSHFVLLMARGGRRI